LQLGDVAPVFEFLLTFFFFKKLDLFFEVDSAAAELIFPDMAKLVEIVDDCLGFAEVGVKFS